MNMADKVLSSVNHEVPVFYLYLFPIPRITASIPRITAWVSSLWPSHFMHTCDIEMSFSTLSFKPTAFRLLSEFINVLLIFKAYHLFYSLFLKIDEHFVPITEFFVAFDFSQCRGKGQVVIEPTSVAAF